MPRPLITLLVYSLCSANLYGQGVDAKRLPAVKRVMDKAEATIRRNRKAYDEANQKALAEAEAELIKEVDRLSKAGKPEEAVAVKKLAGGIEAELVASAEKATAPPNPAQQGAAEWNGHKYRYIAEATTWADAKRKCEELGGHLLIIDDKDEDAFVMRSLSAVGNANPEVWLGITCEGTPGRWRTVRADALSYFRWQRGEPSHSNAVEPCAAINMNAGGAWNDCRGDYRFPFICEWDE